ncbi:MAG: response regulator [Patescibacteria group bacterium]
MTDQKYKIMIVEDQQVLLDLYSEKFVREGYEVLTCTNGLEAVTMLDGFHPSVILLDIMMPQMDGFETLRVMRKLAPSVQTKILVFSNLSGTEHVERCMSL